MGAAPYIAVFFLNLFGGGIATLGIGAALQTTSLNTGVIFIIIIAADTVSDTLYYCLGRFGSGALRRRMRHKRFAKRVRAVETYYRDHGLSTVFLAKMSDVLAIPAIVVAGLTKLPFGTYVAVCVGTSALKTAIILGAGYLLGRSTDTMDTHFVLYGTSGLFVIVLFIIFARRVYTRIVRP